MKTSFLFVLAALVCTVFGNAAVRVDSAETCTSANGQCAAPEVQSGVGHEVHSEADRVLEQAAQLRSDTVEDTVLANESGDETNVDEEPADRAANAWNAAYKQWIEGGSDGGNPKGLSPTAQRAIEEVQKRKAGNSEDAPSKQGTLEDLESLEAQAGDSEMVLLTKAIARLARGNSSDADEHSDLELVEYLCHSGDNGQHVESIGGMRVLLDRAMHQKSALAAVKAVATCAQNNPVVIERCVHDGAVGILISLAGEGTPVLAAALRGLVALRTARHVQTALLQHQQALTQLFQKTLHFNVDDGRNERRAVLRSLALLEQILKLNAAKWMIHLKDAGVLQLCVDAMKSGDEDVREMAAAVIKAAEQSAS